MGDQMMFLLVYVCVAAMVAALINRLWGYEPKNTIMDVPKIAWAILASVAWPATGPAILVYTLVNKALDKFSKV